MTKRSRLLYAFFYRLPMFTILLGIFHILVLIIYPGWQYEGLSWLMALPHTVFFLIKENTRKSRIGAIVQLMALLAISGVIYLLSYDYLSMWLLLGFLFAMFVYSMRSKVVYYEGGFANGALAFNALIAVFYAMIGMEENKTAFYVSLANVIVILLCQSVTQYYANQDFLVHSRWWRHQPKAVTSRVLRKSAYLIYAFTAAVGLILTVAAAQTVGVEVAFLKSQPDEYEIEVTPEPTPNYIEYLETEAPPEPTPTTETVPEDWLNPDYEPLFNWHIPDRVKTALIVTFVVIIIAFCVIFYLRSQDEDEENDEGEDFTEDEAYSQARKLRAAKGKLPSTNMAVRVLFKRKVNDHRKRWLPVKTADTARLLSDEISDREDLLGLDGLYHTARYSGETVTKEDLAEYRKRVKSKRRQD